MKCHKPQHSLCPGSCELMANGDVIRGKSKSAGKLPAIRLRAAQAFLPVIIYFRASRKYFNMIEVTLAIAIVALGMVGIVALFPVGLQSARDAVGDNYVNDSSQLFLSYVKLSAKKDPATITQANIDSQWNATMVTIPTTKPDSTCSTEPTAVFTATSEVPSIYTCSTSGLYRVFQGSTGVNDFKAAVRIWKTPTVSPVYISGAWIYDSPDYSTSNYLTSCAINIEFSWPIEKPYAQRTKRFFYCEIFKKILVTP